MKQEKMKTLPQSEQPYLLCWEHGAESLTDAQLLSVLIQNGTKGYSALSLAHEVLNYYDGGLCNLATMSRKQLMQLKGVGRVKAMQLECVVELAKRLSRVTRKQNMLIREAETVAQMYMQRTRFLTKEHLYCLFLDGKNAVLGESLLSIGIANAALVSPREVFIEALEYKAVYIILLHNHPSGDPSPSQADIDVTAMVKNSGKMIGIELLDHIIIGDNKYVSMKEQNLL